MNPSDWSNFFGSFKKSPKEAVMRTGEAAVRSLVHLITSPPHIKGKRWYPFPPKDIAPAQ